VLHRAIHNSWQTGQSRHVHVISRGSTNGFCRRFRGVPSLAAVVPSIDDRYRSKYRLSHQHGKPLVDTIEEVAEPRPLARGLFIFAITSFSTFLAIYVLPIALGADGCYPQKMQRRPSLALHLWFIAIGSLVIVVTRSGPRTWFADSWVVSCVVATVAALLVNAANRRARKQWIASLSSCSDPVTP
jgi:hypothetical protein